MKVGTEPVDDARSPALLLLPREDVAPDVPVEEHELGIHRERGLDLGRADARLQTVEEGGVADG
jgi:hypothetical protein